MVLKKKFPLSRSFLVSLGFPAIFIPGLILASILGWNWQPDLARLVKSGGYKQSEVIFPRKTTVAFALDGDTIELGNGAIVRMIGVDAPDRGQKGFEEAGKYLNSLVADKEVNLEYDSYQDDKFGRILAYVWKDGEMLNAVMIKKGYAKVVIYEDRRRLKYENLLKSAQAP